jgi:hypothetical protein
MTTLEPLIPDPAGRARLRWWRRTATDWCCALAMVLLLALA